MIQKFLDKFFPVKLYGILASEGNEKRGKCYTVLRGRFLLGAFPAGMVYEKDKEGNPTKSFDLIRIL